MSARSVRADSRVSQSSIENPASEAACSAPRMIEKYTGLVMSETTTPITAVRAATSARAIGFVRYPSLSAVALMRSAVRGLTRPGREKARDTVEGDTPHSRATS